MDAFAQELVYPWQQLAEVLVAALLGGAIGFDREMRDRPAGLRTHMLVAMASALFVALAERLMDLGIEHGADNSDPVRIVEAIVTAVAFLGAGTIFRSSRGEVVTGLTTAASLLFVAALGVAVALEMWLLAFIATALALVVLRVLGAMETLLHRRRELRERVPGGEPRRQPW
jgi:putative Mg2+ transporter-C (MgtC) family protein